MGSYCNNFNNQLVSMDKSQAPNTIPTQPATPTGHNDNGLLDGPGYPADSDSSRTDEEHQQPVPITSWRLGKLLGAGAFGSVYEGLNNLTGEVFAVKQVHLTKNEALKGRVAEHIKALEAEVAVLQQLSHENIVQYHGTQRTEDNLNIFLEYVAGGSIASLLQNFGALEESVVRLYTKQILRGLEYLHNRKIMHRDIKGANILLDPKK